MALDFETEWQKLMSPSYSVPKAGTWDPVSESWQGGIDPNSNNIWSDPRTDPGAMYQFLANNSMVGGNPEDTYNLLVGRGINPDFASQVREAHRSGLNNKGGDFFDFGGLTSLAKETAPLWATALGVNYLAPALGASAGGTGAALGSGITPGAGGVTGLTSGAAGGIAATAPAGTAFAPGFFAAENLPALGGATALGGGITPGAGGQTGLTAGQTSTTQGVLGTGISPAGTPGSALTPGYFGAESASGGATGLAPKGDLPFGLTYGDLARGIPGLLGAVAANEQAGSYEDASNQMLSYGAPSRQRFEASFAPGFSMENEPGFNDALNQAAKSTLHALSVQGNPAGSPNAWSAALNDLYQRQAYNALQEYRRMNAGAGGLAGLTTAAPSFANSAINAGGNVYGALGGAAADIFNPPKSLEQLIKEIRRAGV